MTSLSLNWLPSTLRHCIWVSFPLVLSFTRLVFAHLSPAVSTPPSVVVFFSLMVLTCLCSRSYWIAFLIEANTLLLLSYDFYCRWIENRNVFKSLIVFRKLFNEIKMHEFDFKRILVADFCAHRLLKFPFMFKIFLLVAAKCAVSCFASSAISSIPKQDIFQS
jgi:hypothetical protein